MRSTTTAALILRPWFAVSLLAAALLATGCAGTKTTRFTHKNADLAAIKTVAVLPFASLVDDRTAAEKVHRIFLVELLSRGAVEVIEPGQVNKILAAERIESTERLGPAELTHLGQALKVDGLFLGTVVDWSEGRGGSVPAPQVTLQLRLVETASGATVWSTSASEGGAGAKARLLGFGGENLTHLARKVIQNELEDLTR